jgi:hypothetical protein
MAMTLETTPAGVNEQPPTLAITFVRAWVTRPTPAGGPSGLVQSRG